jgi:predicted Zn-dependent protease with MMP-like domain
MGDRHKRAAADWRALSREAQSAAEKMLTALPAALRIRAEAVPITYAQAPSPAQQADGIEPDTMGLFVGGAFNQGGAGQEEMPPHIILFLENIWEEAGYDLFEFQRQVEVTLLHELGHYLGFDERALIDRDLE